MCNVCGCGDSHIEGHHHSHGDDHHHDTAHHHQHPHVAPETQQPVVIHHHYYHQGDVHHHVHYDASSAASLPSSTHNHEHEVHHVHGDHHQPEKMQHGDLHYGKGEAQVHVAGVSQRQLLTLEQDILGNNNHQAAHNREHFSAGGQLVLNLVSSPGSGKTTLLTETIQLLKNDHLCAVIEGDQQTSNDADRIRATGVPAVQVNTGKGCHLDAQMVHDACHQLDLQESGIVFIENVGNLVCPASFDLGEDSKVVILSVTEGEDKPLKYPNMFAASSLMIINKTDLLPYVDFDIERCIENARKVNPNIQVIKLSVKNGEGMEAWTSWLKGLLAEKVSRL
ncbi:hydrogenase nickel (NiFe) incorporation-associated protein HypB [Photobacterium marinum]|uniref:Hydrogenase maturation factor HypB n=1 Tax=Photobacterium marinum TaxID=1056511 RepID=L8J6P4_9GAMM|nr:hydrogenase nickel incorporation protein HypB [Photobacterium marinum]ELR63858.1 hydrogenase nickel (NiFe) incorporation-associated protein HypB [Photobacterium marinum]